MPSLPLVFMVHSGELQANFFSDDSGLVTDL